MINRFDTKLITNFLALAVIQGANFLLPIIVMPYVIKKIGASGFGIISVAQVVMIYFSTISDYGFNLTATRDIALYKEDKTKVSRIFFLVLTAKIIITILLFIFLLVLVGTIKLFAEYSTLYLLGFTYVIGQTLMVSWFFQGIEKMEYITFTSLASRSLFVLLTFLFINEKRDFIYFLFFLGIGNIIAGLISIFLAIRVFKLRFSYPTFDELAIELKEGWHITVANLSINTYQYTNIFILRLFTNDLIVGYYSIAEKIFFAVRQILGIFSQVIYPRVCQLANSSSEKLQSFFKKIYFPFFLLITGISLTIYLLSDFIVKIFISTSIGLPVSLLKILSLVPIIVCLNIPAYQLLLAFDHKKSYTSILILGTLVNLMANLILCSKLGAVGTALSIIITELFITIGLNQKLFKNKLGHLVNLINL